jgi:hypothetical protein
MSGNDFCKQYLKLDENIPKVHFFQYKNCNKDRPDGKYFSAPGFNNVYALNKYMKSDSSGELKIGSIVTPTPLIGNLNIIKKDKSRVSFVLHGPQILNKPIKIPSDDNGYIFIRNNNLTKPLMYDRNENIPKYKSGKAFLPYWDNFRYRCCANINNSKYCGLYNLDEKNNLCDYFIDDYYKRRKFNKKVEHLCKLDASRASDGCNQVMESYCKTEKGKADKLCSCYTSPFRYVKGAPSCIDKNCISYGYKNIPLEESCKFTKANCELIKELNESSKKNIFDENKFKLYCPYDLDNGTNGNGKNGGNGTNGNGKNSNGGNDSFFEKYKTVIIILIFVAISIVGITVFWLTRKRIT